jgi:uncharacterized membrane protein YwaF
MRTVIIIAVGFIVLAMCVLGPRLLGRPEWAVTGAKIFIVLWLAAALANMWIGVSRAGYSVAEELPIFLLIFALPAAGAGFAWWKLS